MNRIAHRVRVAAVAGLFLAGGVVPLVTSAQMAHADPPENIGVRGFATCVASYKTGSVAIVFDASGSLRQSDPKNMRVPAAQLLVTRLSEMGAALSARIDVRVWTFSVNTSPVTPWEVADDTGVANLQSKIDQLAAANTGIETDYWTALSTASKDLRDHTALGSTPPCRLLVVLSDGTFDIVPRDNARKQQDYGLRKPIPGVETLDITTEAAANRVEAAAQKDLCRDGGVADVMRADEVYIIGVGLSSQTAPDFTLLQSIVEGPVNGTAGAKATCGSVQPRGQFVQANNVKDLLEAFDPDTPLGNSPTSTDSKGHPLDKVPACPPGKAKCDPANYRYFVLDASLTTLTILSMFDGPGVEMNILPPAIKGKPAPQWVTITAGTPTGVVTLGDVPVHYSWYAPSVMSAISVTMDGSSQPTNWSGEWAFYYRDAAGTNGTTPGRVKVSFRSDIAVSLASSTTRNLVLGQPNDLSFTLSRANGAVIPALTPEPKSISISASLQQGSKSEVIASATGKDALALVAPGNKLAWEVPDGFEVGAATLVTSVTIVTAGGLPLQPQDLTQTMNIQPPYLLPTVVTKTLNFGTLRATVPSVAKLQVQGPGCVWVDTASLDSAKFNVLPSGLDVSKLQFTTTANSPATCLSLSAGQTGSVSISLESSLPANGELRGALTVHLVPEASAQADATTTVPLSATFVLNANKLVFAIVMALCLLIGVGVPIAALVWTRRRAARFPKSLMSIESCVIDATYADGAIQTHGAPAWSALGAVTAGGHHAGLTATASLESKAGLRLNTPGYAEVVSEGNMGVGSLAPFWTGKGRPVVRLGLAHEWAFLAPATAFASDPAHVNGTLIVFVPTGKPLVERGADVDEAAASAATQLGSSQGLAKMATASVGKASAAKAGRPGRGMKDKDAATPVPPPLDSPWAQPPAPPDDPTVWLADPGSQR